MLFFERVFFIVSNLWRRKILLKLDDVEHNSEIGKCKLYVIKSHQHCMVVVTKIKRQIKEPFIIICFLDTRIIWTRGALSWIISADRHR